MKTKFNQKQLRAKDSVKFGLTFESLLAGPNFSDQIVEKNVIVNVVESIGIENKWYHKVYVPTVKKTVWIQGSQFTNVPDNIIFAHLKIDPDSSYIEDHDLFSKRKMDNYVIHPGYVTVATTRDPVALNDKEKVFNYGFSFCSPEDVFSKKFGRNKSREMLSKCPYDFCTLKENLSTYERCFRAMLEYVIECQERKIVIPWFPMDNVNDIENFRQRDLLG